MNSQVTTGQLAKEVELGQRAQMVLELLQQNQQLKSENERLKKEQASEDE